VMKAAPFRVSDPSPPEDGDAGFNSTRLDLEGGHEFPPNSRADLPPILRPLPVPLLAAAVSATLAWAMGSVSRKVVRRFQLMANGTTQTTQRPKDRPAPEVDRSNV
jgi:hypothetical protein